MKIENTGNDQYSPQEFVDELKRVFGNLPQLPEPRPTTTITTCTNHGYSERDTIYLKVTDQRWWRRAWFWITFRKNPLRTKRGVITFVDSGTTMTYREIE